MLIKNYLSFSWCTKCMAAALCLILGIVEVHAVDVEVEVHSSVIVIPSNPTGDGGDVSISNDINPNIFFMSIRNACNVSQLYVALKAQGYDILESLDEHGFHTVANESWTTITKLKVKSGSCLNYADATVLHYLTNINTTSGDERPAAERSTGGNLEEIYIEDDVTFCVEGQGYQFLFLLDGPVSGDTDLVTAGATTVTTVNYYCYDSNQIPYNFYQMYNGNTCTLKRVRVGKNITSIGNQAFYRCNSLEGLSFSEEATESDPALTINYWAFGFCTNLGPVIRFPRNLAYIGPYAFCKTSSLNEVYFPRTDQTVKNIANNDYPFLELTSSGGSAYNNHLGVYVPLNLVNQYLNEYLSAVCTDTKGTRVFPMVSPAKEFTTFSYFRPLDFRTINGYYDDSKSLTAYVATSYNSTKRELTMTLADEYPEETGTVLRRPEMVDGELYPIHDTGTAYASLTAPSGNMLIAAVDGKPDIDQTDGSTYTNFLLVDGVFHICDASGGSVSEFKSYLQLPEVKTDVAGAKAITTIWSDIPIPANISQSVAPVNDDSTIYTLQGFKVNNPGKGIYIMSGKKYVVR